MKFEERKSVSDKLRKYCFLADEDDFIEVTQWVNGEGFDVSISRKHENKLLSLTFGEIEAIEYLVKSLDVNRYDKLGD